MAATTEWVVPETEPGTLTLALRRRPWLGPTLVGVGVGLATAYTGWQDPNGDGVFPLCPLKAITHLDCPGCGGLRAVHSLTNGDVAGAFDHNVLVAVLLPLLVVLWAVWMVRALRATAALRRERTDLVGDGAPDPPARRPLFPAVPPQAWYALGVLAIAFAVVRNIEGVGAFEYLRSDA